MAKFKTLDEALMFLRGISPKTAQKLTPIVGHTATDIIFDVYEPGDDDVVAFFQVVLPEGDRPLREDETYRGIYILVRAKRNLASRDESKYFPSPKH